MPSVPAPGPSEPPHELVGTVLRGTYLIQQVLDRGGMGTVFEAQQLRLKRRVAIKVLARHLASDAQALARFRREAEIVSQLQHPHIVQILDFDTTERGEPYIVMEFLQGESLAARLEAQKRVALYQALAIVHQTALALAAAHQIGVVHRDLKPANIFLVPMPGQGEIVKLLDFGISKRPGVGHGLTGEHDILGTPDYMAPEQARGQTAQVDHRGDQYALAVIAFEMLSGRMPFPGSSVMEVLNQVISAEPPAVHLLADDLPAPVSGVLQKAMAKDPEARFGGVIEFSLALSGAAGCSLPPPVEAFGIALTIPAVGPPPSSSDEPSIERFQTGQRLRGSANWQNAFAVAPTLYEGPSSIEGVAFALGQARQAHGLGDLELALTYAESALRQVEQVGTTAARTLVEQDSTLLEHILAARIGPLERRLVVRAVPSNLSRFSPAQAFILSRVDDGITVEEALDLSPLPRRDTLRALLSMIRSGFVATE